MKDTLTTARHLAPQSVAALHPSIARTVQGAVYRGDFGAYKAAYQRGWDDARLNFFTSGDYTVGYLDGHFDRRDRNPKWHTAYTGVPGL